MPESVLSVVTMLSPMLSLFSQLNVCVVDVVASEARVCGEVHTSKRRYLEVLDEFQILHPQLDRCFGGDNIDNTAVTCINGDNIGDNIVTTDNILAEEKLGLPPRSDALTLTPS
ncbi:Uncharacterised protein [Mycobacteroides abscessus subsp. abscessus]|nr:Uncharacterised protein [Mycobacteroides abscessus subsp. abscessus]